MSKKLKPHGFNLYRDKTYLMVIYDYDDNDEDFTDHEEEALKAMFQYIDVNMKHNAESNFEFDDFTYREFYNHELVYTNYKPVLKEYQVVVRKIIMMGTTEETHNVKAVSIEHAENIVEDDCTTYCFDIDYNIEQTEQMSVDVMLK